MRVVVVIVVIGFVCSMIFGHGRRAAGTYGFDHRGPYERQADEEIAKVERDPAKSQSDKDAAIILLDGFKAKARELDEQIAAMTPEQRDAFQRTQREIGVPSDAEINKVLQDRNNHVDLNQSDPGAAYQKALRSGGNGTSNR